MKNTRKGLILTASFTDNTGLISCSWFKYPAFYNKKLFEGNIYIISGRPSYFNGWQISHPIIEELENEDKNKPSDTGQIISLYPLSSELGDFNNKTLRNLIYDTLNLYRESITDIIPSDIIEKNSLLDYKMASKNIPTSIYIDLQ